MPSTSLLRLPVAEPAFDRYAIAELLQESGLHLTDDPEPHVELRCRAPWVQDRGWLNFIGNWHYWSQPPNDHADWVRAIAPDSAGKLEIWMDGLTIGQNYLVSIKVFSGPGGPNPQFVVHSSDGGAGSFTATPLDQELLLVIHPRGSMALVTVEPRDLDVWIFYLATIPGLD